MWPSRGLHKDCIWQLYVCGLWVRGLWVTPTNKTATTVCQRITDRLYLIVVRQFYMQSLWGLYVRFSWSCLVAKGAPVRWIRLLEHNPWAPHFCIDLCIGHEGWSLMHYCWPTVEAMWHMPSYTLAGYGGTDDKVWQLSQFVIQTLMWHFVTFWVTFLACLNWFRALFTKETLPNFFWEL